MAARVSREKESGRELWRDVQASRVRSDGQINDDRQAFPIPQKSVLDSDQSAVCTQTSCMLMSLFKTIRL
jgi:hypothetical protein